MKFQKKNTLFTFNKFKCFSWVTENRGFLKHERNENPLRKSIYVNTKYSFFKIWNFSFNLTEASIFEKYKKKQLFEKKMKF